MIERFVEFLTVLGLGVQTGTIIFFSFVLTPVLFGQLTREEAGRAVRTAFPGYYLTAISALGVALLGALASAAPWKLVLLVGAALGLELYAGAILLPELDRLRRMILDPAAPAESDPAHLEWRRLHGLSVRLNLGALLLGLAALWVAVR